MANDTAVTVIDQNPDAVVEYTLDAYPRSAYNRLIPSDVIGMPTDLIRPIVRTVQLDIERHTYASPDLPEGHRAPNVLGLALLADAAGVDFPNEERIDDGSNPDRAVAKAWATFVDGTGRPRTAVGSRDYDLTVQPGMSDARRKRARGHVFEHAVTRARHRALRLLLGLPQSYPVQELEKPFAVVSFVPNLQHPELREAYKQALMPALAATFGPSAAKQLQAGADVIDLDAADPKNVTPPPAAPTPLPGEKLAAAQTTAPEDVPDFLKPPEAVTQLERREPRPLIEALQESAKESNRKGPADDEQKAYLNDLLGSLGAGGIVPVLVATWGQGAAKSLTAAQAASVANIADSYDSPEAFLEAWREVAARVTVAA